MAAVGLMAQATRPVLYTGRRHHQFRAGGLALLRELVELTGFPITSTLMGLGAYPASGPNWLKMPGMHGSYEANMAMHDCDLMVAVGALRRSRHLARRQVLAGLEEDPYRYRSILDQQERRR